MPTAVVTGASSGIGKAIALALLGEGYTVFAGARRVERFEEMKKHLTPKLAEVFHGHYLDVSDKQSIATFFGQVNKAGNPIAVLINAAGIALKDMSLIDGNPESWEATWSTNVLGVAHCTYEALKSMMVANQGHIIHISSMSGHRVVKGMGVYSASKFAVRAMAEGLRQDLRMRGNKTIRVGMVSPGIVETEFHHHLLGEREGEEYYRGLPDTDKVSSESIASVVLTMIQAPPNCELNDVQVRPTGQLL